MASDTLIHANGVNPLTGRPLLDPMPVAEVAEVARLVGRDGVPQAPNAQRVPHGVDPNDLAQAGWGVVYPALPSQGPRRQRFEAIREALAPLVAHRRAQAGARHFREFWGDTAHQRGEDAATFLEGRGATAASVEPTRVPYYLLLVGAPTDLPFSLQYDLDVVHAVGRLDLPAPADYAAYAQRVLAAERGHGHRRPEVGLWGPASPGDLATQLSSRFLLPPLAQDLALPEAACHLGEHASKARLLDLLGPSGPALLMTASHGAYVPPDEDPARHTAWAGGLITGDWAGRGPVDEGSLLTAADLGRDADLTGLISVHFACFGAGTPRHDGFGLYRRGQVQQGARRGQPRLPPELTSRPFSAPLLQRMLAHPKGSLAAVGHVDVSFASAFLDPKAQAAHPGQRRPYTDLLKRLRAGERLGPAMDAMHTKAARLAHGLAGRIDALQSNRATWDDEQRQLLAYRWLQTLDARNYVVHGDPAVRLAPAAPDRPPAEAPSVQPVERHTPTDEMPEDDLFRFRAADDAPALPALAARLAGWLQAKVDGLETLEVRTWSGPGTAVDPDGPRRLRIVTRLSLSGDAEVLVPEGAGPVDPDLLALHQAMVREAKAQRAELIQLLLSQLAQGAGEEG